MKLKNRVLNIVTLFTFLLLASHSSYGQINTNSNTNKNTSKNVNVKHSSHSDHNSHSNHNSHSSHCTTLSLDREIKLTNFDSEKREIKLNVAKNTTRVSLNVNCIVEVGDLTIEVYNSKGKKQGDFSVEGTSKSKFKKGDTEPVQGQINLDTSAPVEGDWTIKIIPKQAIGKILVRSIQYVNN